MKNFIGFYLWFVILLFFCSCLKEDTVQDPRVYQIPEVATLDITSVAQTVAIAGGNVTSDGGAPILERGIEYTLDSSFYVIDGIIVSGKGLGNFKITVSYLSPGATYFVRAFATNIEGTSYGKVKSFITIEDTAKIFDIDGNEYRTIRIGSQVWMVDNLKTSRYRNGDTIPYVQNEADWNILNTGAQCLYNNTTTFIKGDGRLYNFYAITDPRPIAPFGWHIPTMTEWDILINYLGGAATAGSKLKETGTGNWIAPNNYATNVSGFTALPCGARDLGFRGRKSDGFYWCATIYSATMAWYYALNYDRTDIRIQSNLKRCGFSVRCIRD